MNDLELHGLINRPVIYKEWSLTDTDAFLNNPNVAMVNTVRRIGNTIFVSLKAQVATAVQANSVIFTFKDEIPQPPANLYVTFGIIASTGNSVTPASGRTNSTGWFYSSRSLSIATYVDIDFSYPII